MNNILLPDINTPDVWERMKSSALPLYMYGTGNGADKIIDEMERRDIPLAGIFASDGFVRSRVFRGHTVRSYGDICREISHFAVIMAFGSSRPEVLENVKKIASERTFYCPDVPAVGNTLFDSDFYRENYENILSVYESFADDESRKVYADIINYKLSGDVRYLFSCGTDDPDHGVIRAESYETLLDLGAYTGDTVRRYIEKCPNLKEIFAVEPDLRAYRKLSAYAETVGQPKINAVNAAAWERDEVLYFTSNAGRGSTLDAGDRSRRHGENDVPVTALSPDSVMNGHSVDFIKYDVEGAEKEALFGSKKIISEFSPDLLVSLYHRSEDIFSLPILVREMCPRHKLYLRRANGVPAWDINLYAIYEV